MTKVEFSVSFKGEHVFSTIVTVAPRMRTASPEKVNQLLKSRFPESEGFKVFATETKTASKVYKPEARTQLVPVCLETLLLSKVAKSA